LPFATNKGIAVPSRIIVEVSGYAFPCRDSRTEVNE